MQKHTKLQVKPEVLAMVIANNDFVSLHVEREREGGARERNRTKLLAAQKFRETKLLLLLLLHMNGTQYSVSPAGVRRKMEWHGNLYRTPVTTENYDL
jgi:hypothetical protein